LGGELQTLHQSAARALSLDAAELTPLKTLFTASCEDDKPLSKTAPLSKTREGILDAGGSVVLA